MTWKIYNEDCLVGMKRIPDGSVDMILADPPFGTTGAPFDKRLPLNSMWEQFKRVTKKNAAIVLFSQMPFGAELIMSNRKMFRYEWVYQKALPTGFLNANKMPMRIHENILVFYWHLPTYNPQWFWSKPYKTNSTEHPTKNYRTHKRTPHESDGRRYPVDVLKFKQPITSNEKSWHPQQKPLGLLEYLIKTYTNEDETVLDATMGSGSTGVAAINTGRRFIGFETDKQYYQISLERMKAALEKEQRNLFSRWRNELVEQSEKQNGYFAASVE